MTTIAVSLAALIGNTDVASAQLSQASTASNFSALLNVGAQDATNPAPAGKNHDNNNKQDNGKDQNNQDNSQNGGVFIPVAFVPVPPPKPIAQGQDKPAINAAQSKSDAATTPKLQALTSNSSNNNASQAANSGAGKQADASKASAQTDSTDASQPTNPLRAALKNQLGTIEDILSAIIQSLQATTSPLPVAQATPSTTATPATPATDASSAPTTPVIATPDQGIINILAQLLPQASATPASAASTLPAITTDIAPALPALPILKDIQSLLQQIQDNLPTSANLPQSTTSTTADSNAANLDILTQKIQSDLAQLSQLLTPQTNSATVITETTVTTTIAASISETSSTPATASTPAAASTPVTASTPASTPAATTPYGDAISLLKASISEVKGQLQKLKNDNETTFGQIKTNLQAQFADATQFFKNNQTTTDTSSANTLASDPALPAAPAVVVVASQPTVAPVVTNTNQTFLPPAVVVDIVQAASNSSTSNNDANTGDQNPNTPATITPLSSGQSNPVSTTAANSFSKVLDKVAAAPLNDQVAFQIKSAVGDGNSKIHIQLDPAELGKLEIKLSVGSDGKTSVVITADNSSTLDLLQKDASGLTRALNDAGLTTDSSSLNFNLRGGSQEQGQGGNAQAALTYKKTQPEDEDNIAINPITRSYVVNLAEGLDIQI